jgi:dsRNA-specific ribonuclease
MLSGVLRIPARTGFRLIAPACDMGLTVRNAGQSLTKVSHVMLFGAFFLLTAAQFDRLDRRTLVWCFAATVGLGVVVELEEGATRTGNCRMTDVLPDALGALLAATLLMASAMVLERLRNRPSSTRQR